MDIKGKNMTIEERLENMERELARLKRRNRWLLGAILLVAGGLIVPGMFETTAIRARAQAGGTAKEIRAKKFILEDEKGKVRTILAMSPIGPILGMYDENGKTRATLGMGKDGSALFLGDEKGKHRAELGMAKDGACLVLRDENDKIRIGLGTAKNGLSLGLALADENDKLRFMAGKIEIVTQDGKTIVCPESSLVLFGPDGKVIWSAIK
jgi:hypothetical protein